MIQATGSQPGAIAILQLVGKCVPILSQLTGIDDWPIGKLRLVNFAEIDEGLTGRITEDVAQIMPHAGPRVVQKLTERLLELGVEIDTDQFEKHFPESENRIEALMLHTLSRTHSPLAIELLLDQPRRWKAARGFAPSEEDIGRSQRLNHLIDPPTVVLAGRPNVGKSTLSNLLLGRSMSIALDMPGTTRDYTAGRIELAGLVVEWYDTPGLRETNDPIERKSVEIARKLIDRADLLIAMRDPTTDWPDLPRDPDVYVLNKIDQLESESRNISANSFDALRISAGTGEGIQSLVTQVRDSFVPPVDFNHPGPWLLTDFSPDSL